jgi:hypothetical protein
LGTSQSRSPNETLNDIEDCTDNAISSETAESDESIDHRLPSPEEQQQIMAMK